MSGWLGRTLMAISMWAMWPATFCRPISRLGFFRLRGHDVLMASGSDCFGTPITVQADEEGISPKEVVEKYHGHIVQLFSDLNLSFDIYTRTDTEHHGQIVQDVLVSFWDQGLLSIKEQKQYYSPQAQRFLPDRYVEGTCPHCGYEESRSDQCDNCGKLLEQDLINPRSKIDSSEVILKETTHVFIEWGKLQKRLEKYFESHKGLWRDWVVGETASWLATGLKARAVTRDLDWGGVDSLAKYASGYFNARALGEQEERSG